MKIYIYPLNSLDDMQATLHQDCKQVTLFEANPQPGQQAVLTQVDSSEALSAGYFVQDYLSLTNYALLYEIDEADLACDG